MEARLPAEQTPSPNVADRTLVVVPTYNESANLAELVERFFAAVPGLSMLVVDDASPDGTAELCDRLQRDRPNLHLLRRASDRGLGRAYVAGIRWGLERGYRVIGTMDADLSHDPRHLPAMLALLPESDVVVGSRYVRNGGTLNWGIRRVILSWLANKFAAVLLRVPARDVTSGFRLYRAAALSAVRFEAIRSTGYSFLVEVLFCLHRAGFRIRESPIVFCDRTGGASKLGTREIFLGAANLLRLKVSSAPRGAGTDRSRHLQ